MMLDSSESRSRDKALRALGRFSETMVMLPECGAGTELSLIVDVREVA